MSNQTLPEWADKSKLERVFYSPRLDYSGWVYNLGDGTCRYANHVLMGRDGPRWGDRVPLKDIGQPMKLADHTTIIERYYPCRNSAR